MALVTGDNGPLTAELLIEGMRRGGVRRSERSPYRAWVEAGYCIDAPETLASGSTLRDEFGPGPDDWIVMPSMHDRLSSNTEFTERRQASGGMPGSAT